MNATTVAPNLTFNTSDVIKWIGSHMIFAGEMP